MDYIHIKKDTTFINELEKSLKTEGPFSKWHLFQMRYQAELMTISPKFSGLRVLEYIPHVKFLPHQIETAKRAIEEMNGRAILADEVGLGKTIEAGLILKEYMIRGMITKALILVPASLVNQWVLELNEKFFIPAVGYRKNMDWKQYNIIVSSIDTAKRQEHQSVITNIDYDFVLVDEAHKLKNHKTINYSFVRSLKKKYCLLLTATPIQNRLMEIFNLVSILKPGLLGDYDTFIQQYGKNTTKLKQDAYLKHLIQKVMIRNTRKQTNLNDVERKINTIWLDFTKEEADVYQSLEQMSTSLPSFSKITLLRELCSSREACYLSLKKLVKNYEHLNEQIYDITTSIEQLPHHVKAKKVVELIQDIGNEKVIIFTEYRATQLYLEWYLWQHGITSVPYRGGFNRGKKDWMKQLFKNHAQVLIATEAGGEGINLQFCKHLINYDLPWNPMRLEQRIGRIHRFGQYADVHVYNFAIKHTNEAHVMTLLYEKINLFERIIGHLDEILTELNITDLEREIENIFTESVSYGEAKIKLENLSSVIQHTHKMAVNDEQWKN